ncbi:MAG: sigma 54-interacting transcriptional regulator [Planctomycetota bacterium]|nr:sigma 54-interacting transcriptional regulator [Planctomycetota bacterium]
MAGTDAQTLDLTREAWRAASLAEGLEDALVRLAPSLTRDFHAAAGRLQLFDLERWRVTTAAAFGAAGARRSGTDAAAHPRAELGPEAVERLIRWCAARDAISRRASTPPELVPTEWDGAFVAAPVRLGDDAVGALLLAAEPGAKNTDRLEAALRVLLEPIGSAIGHDRRIHELSRLREAAEAENRALRSRLSRTDISVSVIGAESGLKDVLERVAKVAVTDAPVLILGETGAGKEVIARAIHERSTRASGPIVRVNCGAIAPDLVDSELFGHEKGSFTGATGTHRGWFERADGGTLFLDEIGELSLSIQVRLLRVLQDGTFQRVGGQRALSCDVRIVAATHRNLEEMVAEKSFRQDLWYRIGVFPIRLPSLRERPQDIPDLAAHFAIAAGKRLGAGPLALSREDVELLVGYDWPGNVRELAAVIERAAILGDGRKLDVRGALGGSPQKRPDVASPHPTRPEPPARLASPVVEETAKRDTRFATLEDSQRAHVERALEATRGRIEGPHGAAALLGINPHTLRSRMRKLGLDWRSYRAPRL